MKLKFSGSATTEEVDDIDTALNELQVYIFLYNQNLI